MKLTETGILKLNEKEKRDGDLQRRGFYDGLNVYALIQKKKALGLLK